MIDKPTFAHKAFVTAVACAALFITTMFFYGIVSLVILRPERNAEIAELTDARDHWQARAKELEVAVSDYQVALNFERLFLLVARPDSVALLGDLEKQLENKADFCLQDARKGK